MKITEYLYDKSIEKASLITAGSSSAASMIRSLFLNLKNRSNPVSLCPPLTHPRNHKSLPTFKIHFHPNSNHTHSQSTVTWFRFLKFKALFACAARGAHPRRERLQEQKRHRIGAKACSGQRAAGGNVAASCHGRMVGGMRPVFKGLCHDA